MGPGEGPALMLRLSGRVMRVPCGSSRAYQVDVETIREAVKGLVVGTDEPELSYTGKLKVFLCIFECLFVKRGVLVRSTSHGFQLYIYTHTNVNSILTMIFRMVNGSRSNFTTA